MKKGLIVLVGVVFFGVGNVFSSQFKTDPYFSGNGTLYEQNVRCKEGAHIIFKKDMTNIINKGGNAAASTPRYIEAMSAFAKNCGSCDSELFKRIATSVLNNTINPVF